MGILLLALKLVLNTTTSTSPHRPSITPPAPQRQTSSQGEAISNKSEHNDYQSKTLASGVRMGSVGSEVCLCW